MLARRAREGVPSTNILRFSAPASEESDLSTPTQGCTEALSLSNLGFLLEQVLLATEKAHMKEK